MALRKAKIVGPALIVAGLIAAVVFAMSFPAVEGLGTKARLPVFHGAFTWVNLVLFAALGVAALVALIGRSPRVYHKEEALRWVSVVMWVIGTVLGLVAAMNTWDFTGSKSSRLEAVSADPRLMAQFWILLAGLALLAVGFMMDDRRWLSAFDLGFVVIAAALLGQALLGPGRALHPDSPVLNSPELGIKLLFFGMVGSIAVAAVAAVWLVARVREEASAKSAADSVTTVA